MCIVNRKVLKGPVEGWKVFEVVTREPMYLKNCYTDGISVVKKNKRVYKIPPNDYLKHLKPGKKYKAQNLFDTDYFGFHVFKSLNIAGASLLYNCEDWKNKAIYKVKLSGNILIGTQERFEPQTILCGKIMTIAEEPECTNF